MKCDEYGHFHWPQVSKPYTMCGLGCSNFSCSLLLWRSCEYDCSFYAIIYQIGMISLTMSAILPQLRPPPCKGEEVCQEASTGQLAILYVSLLLSALGSGGIRPCVVAFGADQFDESDPNQKTRTWTYFNWYYFVMGDRKSVV